MGSVSESLMKLLRNLWRFSFPTSFFIMLVSQNCSCQLGAGSQEVVSLAWWECCKGNLERDFGIICGTSATRAEGLGSAGSPLRAIRVTVGKGCKLHSNRLQKSQIPVIAQHLPCSMGARGPRIPLGHVPSLEYSLEGSTARMWECPLSGIFPAVITSVCILTLFWLLAVTMF